MMFVVYAIRLKDDPEARYIGQTGVSPWARLREFLAEAAHRWRTHSSFHRWLSENRENVEAVIIAEADTRADARRIEREAVNLCLGLGHRLFNNHLVPADKRIGRDLQEAA